MYTCDVRTSIKFLLFIVFHPSFNSQSTTNTVRRIMKTLFTVSIVVAKCNCKYVYQLHKTCMQLMILLFFIDVLLCFSTCYDEQLICTKTCARDCKWNQWSTWSTCSRSCGVGMRRRKRTLKATAINGGTCEENGHEQIEDCNTDACERGTISTL